MIKIKLIESRTLPVPQETVDEVTRAYRAAYVKLVIDFINKQSSSNPRLSTRYGKLLKEIEKKYAKEIGDIGQVGFTGDLDVNTVIKNGEVIEAISIEQFIMALVAWPELETYLRGRIKPAAFKNRLKRYFKNKDVNDIQFVIEFGSRGTTTKKDYAGLYKSDIDEIIVTFNSSFFVPTETPRGEAEPGLSVGSRSIPAIIENIDTELEDTKTSVRHELQHLFQNTMSNVLGAGDWKIGLPPRDVLDNTSSDERDTSHHLQHIEMQTDLQDEADKFLSYVERFKQKNPDKLSIFPQAVKILLKLFIDSQLTAEESKFAAANKLQAYVLPSDLLKSIKKSPNTRELYDYASGLLYNSIKGEMPSLDKLDIPLAQRYNRSVQENIIMNKIKIVLKESSLINEEISKDELRKIIRDEFEKLLRDKDSKKEIAKITKEFVKKFYRELSFSSTHVIDQIDI